MCGRRTAHLTKPAFYNHLLTVHASLVINSSGLAPYLKRYVQNHVREDIAEALPVNPHCPWDSVIELWWPDINAMQTSLNEPEYLANVRPDEGYFTDRERLLIQLAREHQTFEFAPQRGDVKCFDFLAPRQGVSVDELLSAVGATTQACYADIAQPVAINARTLNLTLQDETAALGQPAQHALVVETWVGDTHAYQVARREEMQRLEGLLDAQACFSVAAMEFPILDRTR